jgi:hypothetical protein
MRILLQNASIKKLQEALGALHYSRLKDDGTEWQHGLFHLFIYRKGRRRFILSLHADIPCPKPPFSHRAKRGGKELEVEMQKIKEEEAVPGGEGKSESKPRPYESDLCRGCVDKGSSYCKNQCPYNVWRKPAD